MATVPAHNLVTDANTALPGNDNSLPTLHQDENSTPTLVADSSDENDPDDPDVDDEDDDDTDAGSLVGVSISRAQTDMKSPTTPAITKAQALAKSQSYFGVERDEEQLFEEPSQVSSHESSDGARHTVTSQHDRADAVPALTPKNVTSEEKLNGRTSLVSSIIAGTSGQSRPRSSSGSTIMENFKKYLPAMPSINMPKLYSSADSNKAIQGTASPSLTEDERTIRPRRQTYQQKTDSLNRRVDSPSKSSKASEASSGMPTPSNRGDQRPQLIRRVTSDSSLYLRRAPTGASDFDDYTAFSNISEMVNSRFKAITDSFQDSAFRRPKLPSLGVPANHSIRPRADSGRGGIPDQRGVGRVQNGKSGLIEQPPPISDLSTSKHPLLKSALARMSGDLLIMGGYRGSILREAESPNRQLWVPIKVGMNIRKADLEVGLTREDELKMQEKIIPDGALSHIGPVDICRRLLRKVKHCPCVRSGRLKLHNYGYDWRLSPDLLADRLIQYLETLPCNRTSLPPEERGAWVVAHSLGGLLTRYAINKRPDLVAGVVYAGTPQNCVNILGPLRNGDDVLFSSRVLTAQVNFTLRTSFALLPQDGRCFINKQTGERYDVNFFNAKMWNDYRLSPCIRSPLPRYRVEHKRSIMGSITNVLSDANKRGPWFGPSTSDERSQPSQSSVGRSEVKEQVGDVKENIEDAAEAMKPARPLSPTMQDGPTQSAKQRPAVATQVTISLQDATEYLTRTLTSVSKFKSSLAHVPEIQSRNAYPPASILFAKNTPTVYGAFVSSREDIKYDDAFDDLAFAAGDGVVLASAAQLPPGYRCVRKGRVESDRGHVGLLGDLEGVGKCLHALLDARSRGVGLGAYDREGQKGKTRAEIQDSQ